MTISKVDLLNDTGVTAGSYTLSNITISSDGRITSATSGGPSATGVTPGTYTNPTFTVGADGRLTYAQTLTTINLLSTAAAGDGDILSAGGSDGQFGLFNTDASATNRNIQLNLKNNSGVYTPYLTVIRDTGTGTFLTNVATNFRAATSSFVITNGDGLTTWGDRGDVVVNGGVDGTWGLALASNAADRNIGFYTFNDYGGIFPPLSLGRSPTTGRFYVAVNSAAPSAGCDLYVNSGNLNVNGVKNFRINHPLNETKYLVHTSVEAPRADLIYRGTVQLVAGTASITLDEEYGLISGTWEELCRNPQVWVTSVDGWELCKGSVVNGVLTIQAKDPACVDLVSWLVVAERQDEVMFTYGHDEDGRPILEPDKEDTPITRVK
jgi:hypothetical protein